MSSRRHLLDRASSGLTVLEMMIVIAILGMSMFLLRGGFRALTKADLVEDSTELATLMKRTSQLAIEHGELHRMVFDLDKQLYAVEVCQGKAALVRNEALRAEDDDEAKRAIERGKDRLQQLPGDALAAGDPDEAMRRASAIAGHHVADRMCIPGTATVTGDTRGKEWIRALRVDRGIKFKQIWVQHRDDGATKGQVAIYFWPNGASEKAVVEVTDGDEVFSVLVHGLTGQVQLRDGRLHDVDDHMLRNAMGDKDAKREDQR